MVQHGRAASPAELLKGGSLAPPPGESDLTGLGGATHWLVVVLLLCL